MLYAALVHFNAVSLGGGVDGGRKTAWEKSLLIDSGSGRGSGTCGALRWPKKCCSSISSEARSTPRRFSDSGVCSRSPAKGARAAGTMVKEQFRETDVAKKM